MKMRNRKEYKADAAERVAGSVSKKRRMDIVRTLLVPILLLALPSKTFAQWGFDVASVEAYINDHKKQRSLLLARSTLEYSNKLLHGYSKDETKAYKELNVDLDKYTRAFDVIDVLYQSLRTSLNVYSTYEGVSDRISDYKKLLDDYNKKVIKRKRISLADTILIGINRRAIENIANEGEYLYKSVSDLVLYATGAAACSTADLLVVLESINTSLDNIDMSIWAKIAKYGGSALKGAGSVAKQGLKSASNTAVHPTQALKGAGSAMKTAAVGSAAGYVAWQNLVNDKSMVEIASDVVVGKDTTEKISEAVEDVKGLKNKAGEAVDAVNGAMGDINSKWSGMSNFFRGIFGGNGLEMFGNFFKNLGKGNVSGLSLAGLVTAAFLTFGRFGWLGKIAGSMLGMMLIGNNSNIKNIVSGDGGQGRNVNEAETTTRSGGMKR